MTAVRQTGNLEEEPEEEEEQQQHEAQTTNGVAGAENGHGGADTLKEVNLPPLFNLQENVLKNALLALKEAEARAAAEKQELLALQEEEARKQQQQQQQQQQPQQKKQQEKSQLFNGLTEEQVTRHAERQERLGLTSEEVINEIHAESGAKVSRRGSDTCKI